MTRACAARRGKTTLPIADTTEAGEGQDRDRVPAQVGGGTVCESTNWSSCVLRVARRLGRDLCGAVAASGRINWQGGRRLTRRSIHVSPAKLKHHGGGKNYKRNVQVENFSRHSTPMTMTLCTGWLTHYVPLAQVACLQGEGIAAPTKATMKCPTQSGTERDRGDAVRQKGASRTLQTERSFR